MYDFTVAEAQSWSVAQLVKAKTNKKIKNKKLIKNKTFPKTIKN
jgi:hypothetical protein